MNRLLYLPDKASLLPYDCCLQCTKLILVSFRKQKQPFILKKTKCFLLFRLRSVNYIVTGVNPD